MTDLAIDGDLLLRHYERLTAAEVVEGLSSLTADDLGRVKEREIAGRHRVTVLRRIASLEGSPKPQPRPRSASGAIVIHPPGDDSAADEAPLPAPAHSPPPPPAPTHSPPPPPAPVEAPAPGAMPAWANPAQPAPAAPGYAHPANAAGPYAQDPARLHQIAAVREKAMRSVVLWSLAVMAAIAISVVTYMNAGAGDTYFVWWGPVVFGVWRIFQAASVLFRLRSV